MDAVQFFSGYRTAIVSGKIIFAKSDETNIALLFTGLIVSILWYLMSAEDKFLVDIYRAEIEETFRQLEEANEFESQLAAPLYHVGQINKVDLKQLGVKRSLLSWRLNAISITHMGSLIALLATVCWAGWLMYEIVLT